MIITLTYTPDEERDSSGIFHFSRAMLPDAVFWLSKVTAEQYETALLARQNAMEAPDGTIEPLLNFAKGIVGLPQDVAEYSNATAAEMPETTVPFGN